MSQRLLFARARLGAGYPAAQTAAAATHQPAWLVAAIIVPQMIFGMVFIIPITQGLLVRLSARRQPDQTDTH